MIRLASLLLLLVTLAPLRASADDRRFDPQIEFVTGAVFAGGSSDYGYGVARRLGYGGLFGVRAAPEMGMFVPMITAEVAGGGGHASFAEVTDMMFGFRLEAGLGLKLDFGHPFTVLFGGGWSRDSTFMEFSGASLDKVTWGGLFGRVRTQFGGVGLEAGISEGHSMLKLVQLLAGVRIPLVRMDRTTGFFCTAEVRHTVSLTSQTGGTWAGLLLGFGM